MNFTEQEGENGFNLHQQIAANELLRRRLLGNNIKLLSIMKDKKLYKAVLGDEKAEWIAYLGQVETFYSRNEIYNLMRVYDKFVVDLGYEYATISDIPISRLIALLPIINDDRLKEELLEQARMLTSRDFNDVIRAYKGLPTTNECTHEYKKFESCKHCGERHELKECDETAQ